MCARFGGDEFLLAICHVNAIEVETAINRMREQFSTQAFLFAGQSVSLTATFGAASVLCCEPKQPKLPSKKHRAAKKNRDLCGLAFSNLTAQSSNHTTRILNHPGVIEEWGYIKDGREVGNRWRPTWGDRHSPL